MTTIRVRAPGRVNLMGDHTDYNEGFVLPLAIELECTVSAELRDDGAIHARSREQEGQVVVHAGDDPRSVSPPWGRYVAAVAATLDLGVGATLELSSSVPAGSGLSSSAALEVACALALCGVAGRELPPRELALACQRAEQVATGVPSGIMDQLASVCGVEGAALLIDCRDLSIEAVTVPDELAIVIVDSGVTRTLEGSAYAERRAACEQLAGALGLRALRDASWDEVRHHPLGRHVVSENERVHATARALAEGDADALTLLFAESHASLRDDYRVSTHELDAIVEHLVEAGAIGARLTGAGFGGAVVALSRSDEAAAIAARFPRAWVTRPTAGAGRVD